jgi:GNAT superfamily N-acetyltransferase
MTNFRRAALSDIPALLPLVAEYWSFENVAGFDSERVAAQLTRLLSNPALGAGWIAEADGVAVGYLLAVYVFSLEHLGLTAEIDELFVLPAQQGQGVGSGLLALAEAEFDRAGCTNVALQLSRGNDGARAFYRRHAYRERSAFELLDKMLSGHG